MTHTEDGQGQSMPSAFKQKQSYVDQLFDNILDANEELDELEKERARVLYQACMQGDLTERDIEAIEVLQSIGPGDKIHLVSQMVQAIPFLCEFTYPDDIDPYCKVIVTMLDLLGPLEEA